MSFSDFINLALCQVDSGKIFITYLTILAIAMMLDDRIIQNFWRAQLNPFSVSKYGWPAIVNISFVVFFIVRFIAALSCKNGNI
jgi:hypothetical protein